jgi:hypothetical protein
VRLTAILSLLPCTCILHPPRWLLTLWTIILLLGGCLATAVSYAMVKALAVSAVLCPACRLDFAVQP